MVSIYALINPISDQVFYIGATKNPTSRLKQHHNIKSGSNKLKIEQTSQILSANKRIEMLILEECTNEKVQFLEEYYTDLFFSFGFKLCQSRISGYSSTVKPYLYVRISTRIPTPILKIYEDECLKLDRPLYWLFEKAIKEYTNTFYKTD